jgi:hypothetical protein
MRERQSKSVDCRKAGGIGFLPEQAVLLLPPVSPFT